MQPCLEDALFGVSSQDPLIYATVAAGVIGIGAPANFLPAGRSIP